MALAYDSSATSNTGSASSLTYSHTCSGVDRILLVQVWCGSNRTISSITYNGVSMTELSTLTGGSIGAGERTAVYYLIAPATGANNVVVTLSGATSIASNSASYTGVDQTNPIDASRTETDLDTGTSYAESITSNANNCWAVWGTREYAGRTITAGANTAVRQRESSQYGIIWADSNASITPAGSRTMNLNANASGNWLSDILITILPSATNYPLTADVGTFALTGINVGLLYGRKLAMEVGTFVLTGIDVAFNKGYGMIAEVGSFILTGIAVTLRFKKWTKATKSNTDTYTQATKSNTSTWTKQTKN